MSKIGPFGPCPAELTSTSTRPQRSIARSTNRAKSIVDYLVKSGIAMQRLRYKGYGSANSIGDNQTESGRAKNRRTTFTVVGL